MTKHSVKLKGGNGRGRDSQPLTGAENAALDRAEADIETGRLRDHSEVAKWLRRRAAGIVERAGKAPKPR